MWVVLHQDRTGRPTGSLYTARSPAPSPWVPGAPGGPVEARRHRGSRRRPAREPPGRGRRPARGFVPVQPRRRPPACQRRSPWLDPASARRALVVQPRTSRARRASRTTSPRCSPGPSAKSRPPCRAAASRRPCARSSRPSPCCCARSAPASARADRQREPARRAAQAPGRHRGDPRQDRRPGRRAAGAARRGRRSLRRGPLAEAGPAPGRGVEAPPRRSRRPSRRTPAAPERRVVPPSVTSRQLSNPFLAPDFSAPRPGPGPPAPPGRLGAARPAAELVRARWWRGPGVHGAPGTDRPVHSRGPGADAAPGPG